MSKEEEKTSLVQDISKKIIKETQLNGDYEFDTDFTIKDLVEQTAELGIQKGKDLATQDIQNILVRVRMSERSGLNALPAKIAIQEQSGYLLGYADCWNKIKKELTASHRQKTDGKADSNLSLQPSSRSGTRGDAGFPHGTSAPEDIHTLEDGEEE